MKDDERTRELLSQIDYAKAEERILANLGTSTLVELARIFGLTLEELQAAQKDGTDLYTLSAAKEFGVPFKAVTDHMRKVIKLSTFNKLYEGTTRAVNSGPGTGRIR